MTNDQIALIAHIDAINAKTQAWIDEAPESRMAGIVTNDVEHWAGYGITTVDQYDHYMAACNNFEIKREIYGYKPRWNYDGMTTAEIEADTTRIIEQEHGLAAVDAEAAEKLAGELGHSLEDLKRWGVV